MQQISHAATPGHPNGDVCVLCGSGRRTYLFVVGRSRMTRCDECQLVSRSDEGRLSVQSESYALDDDSERQIRAMLAAGGTRRKVLAIVDRGGPHTTLREDPRLDVTLVTGTEALSALPVGAYDAAFVNGAVEQSEPLALL
jgi:hypothetical protein